MVNPDDGNNYIVNRFLLNFFHTEKLSCNKCGKSWIDYKEFDMKQKYEKSLAEFKIWTAPTKTNEEGTNIIPFEKFRSGINLFW